MLEPQYIPLGQSRMVTTGNGKPSAILKERLRHCHDNPITKFCHAKCAAWSIPGRLRNQFADSIRSLLTPLRIIRSKICRYICEIDSNGTRRLSSSEASTAYCPGSEKQRVFNASLWCSADTNRSYIDSTILINLEAAGGNRRCCARYILLVFE